MSTKMLGRAIFALAVIISAMNLTAMPSYDDVLVVVNGNSPQSLEIGEYFKNARKIPDKNICHISVTDLQDSGSEANNMPLAERNSAIAAVKKYLSDNVLADKINYIVLTRGIPYFSQNDPSGSTNYQLFDLKLLFELSESATTSSIPDIFTCNKYYYYMTANYNNQADYKFAREKYGYYIVARLDGPGTVNIKKMIDNTGYPAYQSPKKEIKYLTTTPFFQASVTAEIKSRGNIKVVAPDLKNGEDMRDVGQDIMFGYWNRVDFSYPAVSATTEYLAPYYASKFYADTDVVSHYPNIYYGLSFLPGSVFTCFRSYPSKYNHRMYGGMFKYDPVAAKLTDYQKKDGSDMKFRHMSCIEYDPVNNWVWCGAGDKQLAYIKGFPSGTHADTGHKYEAGRGGGIAIFDKDGNILNHLTKDNSPLLNNRVTKIAYDKYANRMWLAHYGGIQYYDLANKTWHEITGLKNDFAAPCWIYIDPYDTDKAYFSFFYMLGWNSSQLPGADTCIFEYSKSAGTVKKLVIDSTVKGFFPLITKTSTDTLWVTKGSYGGAHFLYKYDLKTGKALEKIDIKNQVPEIASLVTGDTYSFKAPSSIVTLADSNTVLVAVSCLFTYKTAPVAGKPCASKTYVLRVTDNGAVASTLELVNVTSANLASFSDGANFPYGTGWSLIVDPLNADRLYMSYGDSSNAVFTSKVFKSADQGKTWSTQFVAVNLREITADPAGNIYGARGYNISYGQQSFSDFQAFGLCAWAGGLSHDAFTYNPTPAVAPSGGTVAGTVYSSTTDAEYEAYCMMFMMLDGYYTGEARYGIFKQYPASGGGGYIAHMLCFEPKCAPYAPRVDEENLNPMIAGKKTIEIPLRSPGLPLAMDSFMAATISNNTVSVKDELGQPVAAAVEYKSVGNKIVLTGDFSGAFYQVTLKCGINGIKNIKGASLTNTRANEFKDEITYTFGISTEIYTPPADVTGPVKMPSTNSKCDLIVSKVGWTGKPTIGQPLTVNFEISNLGTAKTTAGTGVQKAKLYLNNVLADVKTYNDIAPKGKVSLIATIPGASIVGGKQCKVMAWADATDKVAEIRETNNTNSASFMIETRADLIVKEITLSPKPKAKAPLTINFKISNIGASATAAGAGGQVATVFVDGKSVGAVAYDDVPKSGSVVKQLILSSGIATAGVHKIKVVADTNKIVDEISELNNSLEKSFSIAK